jgi:acetyltransferase-like isoleucine patch superfamily enzyme
MPHWKYKLDDWLFRRLVCWLWPTYTRPRYGYMSQWRVLRDYFFWQKIVGYNRKAKWPVHFTSTVRCPEKIQKGIICDPGDSPSVYINAHNGIIFGNNVGIGPQTTIVSTNHSLEDYRNYPAIKPIVIGSNVWIGSHVCILAGVQIGSNVIIGAGSVVTRDIPDNCIAVGNPCKKIKDKAPYTFDILGQELNRKLHRKY